MKKIALFCLPLALCSCADLPSASNVEQAFARAHPDFKVREVLLSEQKDQDRYTAQFTIRYSKPTDTPAPLDPRYPGEHMDVWYYRQENGKWVAGKREVCD